jgi:hypothetical protein
VENARTTYGDKGVWNVEGECVITVLEMPPAQATEYGLPREHAELKAAKNISLHGDNHVPNMSCGDVIVPTSRHPNAPASTPVHMAS